MTCSQNGTRTRGLSAVSHQAKYQLFHLTYRKNWWTRSPSSVWVNLDHFSIFFCWEISSWSNVNLVLNHTNLSFNGQETFNDLLSLLIFLNIKKQSSQLNTKKRLVDRVGLEPTIVPYFFTCRLLWGFEPHSRCPGRFTILPPIHFSSTKIKQ